MEYIRIHVIPDDRFNTMEDPVEMWSELDAHRDELRKIHVYSDGRVECASPDREFDFTALSLTPIPTIDEINRDAQFKAMKITEDEFEEMWSLQTQDQSL